MKVKGSEGVMSTSVNPISFQGYRPELMEVHRKANQEFLSNASNKDLREMANDSARSKYQNKLANISTGAVAAGVAADMFINGALLTAGTTATKVGGAASHAGIWAGVFAVGSVYDKAARTLTENVPFMKKVQEEHPVVATILYITGLGAALGGAWKGAATIGNYLNTTKNANVRNIMDGLKGITADTGKLINNSWINNKMLKPVAEYAGKIATQFPKTTGALKTVAPYAPLLVLPLAIYQAYKATNTARKDNIDTYYNLKAERSMARADINDNASIQRYTTPRASVSDSIQAQRQAAYAAAARGSLN